MATHEEAVAHKAAVASRVAAGPGAIWNYTIASDPVAAADFVNLAPPQGAGEACFTNRADGQVDVYYFL